MTHSTENLISDLVEDLAPVKPVLPMRLAVGLVLGVAAGLIGVVLIRQEGPLGASHLLSDSIYLATFLGLTSVAVGGTISAIASGRPGREGLETSSRWGGVAGLAAGALTCGFGMASLGLGLGASPSGFDAGCLERSILFSLLPALVIGFFVLRGWSTSPFLSALIALASAGGIGGVLVHLSCPFLEPQHLLLGHLSAPVILAALGFYPLGLLFRRLRA